MPDEREPPEHTAPDEGSPKGFDVIVDGVIDVEWRGRIPTPQEIHRNHPMVRCEQRNELLERNPGRRDSVNENDDGTVTLVYSDLEEGNASRHERI
jgi:hypothetical protein